MGSGVYRENMVSGTCKLMLNMTAIQGKSTMPLHFTLQLANNTTHNTSEHSTSSTTVTQTDHLEAWLARELRPALLVDAAIIVKHVDGLQVVALACLEIVGVVGGSDLRTCEA